jgi:hypothetical protein
VIRALALIGAASLAALTLLTVFGLCLYRTGRAQVAAWDASDTGDWGDRP